MRAVPVDVIRIDRLAAFGLHISWWTGDRFYLIFFDKHESGSLTHIGKALDSYAMRLINASSIIMCNLGGVSMLRCGIEPLGTTIFLIRFAEETNPSTPVEE